MGSEHLSNREKWQDIALEEGTSAELNIFDVFTEHFKGTEYVIRKRPKELENIYKDKILSEDILSEVFVPEKEQKRHGIILDSAIDNTRTNKTIYIESKKQNGYVEGGEPEDGRGNVHERLNKYFAPGLQKILREKSNLSESVLPFWAILQGDITRDKKRVTEIMTWFEGYESHVFLWRNRNEKQTIIDHFENHIKSILE